MQLTSISETSSKDVSEEQNKDRMNTYCSLFIVIILNCFVQGLTVICSKRGGDVFLHNHSNWLQTVAAKPEAIHFKFVPIVSLLAGIPGSGYLSHAINLYLRCKCLLP